MPAKRYFEFSEGSSNKFWEVWCDGAEVFTRYGKIGSSGQLTVKAMGSKDAAKTPHATQARSKLAAPGRRRSSNRSNAAPIVAKTTPRPSNLSSGHGDIGVTGVMRTSKSRKTSPMRALN